MASPARPTLDGLLDDWCRSIESGEPDRITALYDHKATVAYMRRLLQGREELDDLLHVMQRRLRKVRITTTKVEHASAQRLVFDACVVGPFGELIVRNDWTVQEGRIRDHAMSLVAYQPDDSALAA